MIYTEKDPETGNEFQNDLSMLPYISIPKDTLLLASQLLTAEQFGNVMFDLIDGLYCNCQSPEKTNTHTEKVLLGMFRENIGRLSVPYFKKLRNLKNNKQNKNKE